MAWESAAVPVTVTSNGFTIYGVDRLYSAILSGDGTNAALAILTFPYPTSTSGNRTITLRCTSTQSAVYAPSKPVSVNRQIITVTLTTAGTAELNLGVYGPDVYVSGPTKNLIARVTSRVFSTKNLVSRVTGLNKSSANLICRVTQSHVTGVTKDLISRITIFKRATSNLICQIDVQQLA